jgi:hypothetical protein
MSPVGTIDIASIVVKAPKTTIFTAKSSRDFEQIKTGGDAQRLAHPKFLRVKITGIDPQLYLPPLAAEGDQRLVLEMRVQVHAPGSRAD